MVFHIDSEAGMYWRQIVTAFASSKVTFGEGIVRIPVGFEWLTLKSRLIDGDVYLFLPYQV